MKGIEPLWHRPYAVDCRTQSCPNTRQQRIGGGDRTPDTALAPLSAVPCRHARPQRSQLSRATTFIRCSLLLPGETLFVGVLFSKSPARRHSQARDKGLPTASISYPHPHQTHGAPAAVG